MTPERWQQIERIFEAALECEPEKRSAFLDQTCGDDAELRHEVEAMLRADEAIAYSLTMLEGKSLRRKAWGFKKLAVGSVG